MAIAKMSKITLMGLSAYKDDILNAVHRTGCVELSATDEVTGTFATPVNDKKEGLTEKYLNAKRAIEFMLERVDRVKKDPCYPDPNLLKHQFVTIDEFTKILDKEPKILEVIDKVKGLENELHSVKTEILKLNNTVTQITPYVNVKEPFSAFKSTKKTTVFFGTIKAEINALKNYIAEEYPLSEFNFLEQGQQSVIAVVVYNEGADGLEHKLNESGFVPCPFTDDVTPLALTKRILDDIKKFSDREDEIDREIAGLCVHLKDLDVYTDYHKFLIEKLTAEENFRCTAKTFMLKGYVPKDCEDVVRTAIEAVNPAVFITFSEPTEEDNPPILLKNKNPVKQAEFVTDMYSPPNYKELDPNKVVFFFFMLFMGVIMADIGYGLLMIGIGLFLSSRIKVDNGSKRLWNIIALSGISTIIFGLLFNSFFGMALPYSAVLPNPVPKGGNMDGLMIVLLMCLGLGVVHIATGYMLKALNSFKQGDVAGGIFDGLTWVVFFIGLIFATFNFLLDYLMSDTFVLDSSIRSFFDAMTIPGIAMVVGSVLIAMLTAGRKEKGFGKFSKGFGAVYGIINIMSDILSYARLFGLMLSGMIIASTFNDMGLGIMASGGITYVLGGLVIVVGHVFNIAMGVLGAYIHNSRLQYIEFFGKFYTGEGNKFTPLGSQFDYIYLIK
ncbi:MAG: V-type ATP synthase subunit I [Clostridiales bacterium]|nr:V-type ATP synthase subunit I [Clostridiales bacterium]